MATTGTQKPGYVLRELRVLSAATTTYLQTLQEFDAWAAKAIQAGHLRADVVEEIEHFRQLVPDGVTPARVAGLLAELLGEA